jgi:hypothetical protein
MFSDVFRVIVAGMTARDTGRQHMSTQRTHHVTTTDGVIIGSTVHGQGPLVFLQGSIGDGDLDWLTAGGGTRIVNSATVSSPNHDPVAGNNTASVAVDIKGKPTR